MGGVLAGRGDAIWRNEALAPALLAITATGIYVAVPDTEHALALVGVAIPLALLAWPVPLVRLGSGGGAGAAALLVWVRPTAVEGAQPHSSVR